MIAIAVGAVLLAFGGLIIVATLATIAQLAWTRSAKAISFIPLVGGACVFAGCLLLPIDWRFGFAGLLDPGTTLYLLWPAITLKRRLAR